MSDTRMFSVRLDPWKIEQLKKKLQSEFTASAIRTAIDIFLTAPMELMGKNSREFITIKEFIQITGIPKTTVYRYCKTGKIPAQKIYNKYCIPKWYIDELRKRPTVHSNDKTTSN